MEFMENKWGIQINNFVKNYFVYALRIQNVNEATKKNSL